MSNKIIIQNMTLKGIENVPGVLDYDQRGLILARENDTVITRTKVDPEFIKYLNSLGFNIKEKNLIHSNEENQTYDSIYNDERIINLVKQTDAKYIDTYQLTSLETDFAKKTDKVLYGNTRIAEKYGTKSGFREFCKKLNIPIVDGYENLKDPKEILHSILKIQKSKRILLRLDEGVSGAGNFVIEYNDFIKLDTKSQIEEINKILNKLPQRMQSSGLTVERWLDDVTSSPSFQFEVQANGEIILLSSHEQLLEGNEKWFVGCKYPSETFGKSYTDALHEGFKFMQGLKDEGFIGHCGIDYILTKESFYLVEANIRRQGTAYPREFVRKVFGSLEDIEYMAKDIQNKNLIGTSFIELKNKLKDFLISPSQSKLEGILLFNTGALSKGGRFDVVIVANKESVRQSLLKEVMAKIS